MAAKKKVLDERVSDEPLRVLPGSVDPPVPRGPHKIVDNWSSRGDHEAFHGGWVDVVGGEHVGRFGHFAEVARVGSDGYPETIWVRTRDADNLLLEVPYSDVRPSSGVGGR